ncbi:MAG: phosphoribosylformylglycinamidine synthase subunit PurS [Myxococcota bacterium]|nr:phosphoribosylformylglycinamidine synthase subunit PurS [Myxococcota bacterium]NRA02709.1 phosphoribosylformylglycinamidine synthase subunit PurS [Myxococcales bacterium]
MKVRILISPRPGILDPEGSAVAQALSELGYTEVTEVRAGRVIRLELDADDPEQARLRAVEMCEKLLANPVIEIYEIEIEH